MTGKELNRWSDNFMFSAEASNAADGPQVFLLGGPNDPLGQIAACAKMYKGEVVRDLRDVTDQERRNYLEQIQKTVLKMPLEAVHLHFMIEGVTRSFTHQMVRQRTAAYAQESMRFAVKEDAATAVALPPSLDETLSLDQLVYSDMELRRITGMSEVGSEAKDEAHRQKAIAIHREHVRQENLQRGGPQAWRLRWDEAVKANAEDYLALINDGMPAEDARGLAVHNITTRLNYITNLRSWYDTMAVRVSDQAQFEWRAVAMHMAKSMMEYGAQTTYLVWVDGVEAGQDEEWIDSRPAPEGSGQLLPQRLVRRSSEWQYTALAHELKPIEFKIGGPAFGADFDRPSRIGERVREFHKYGVPSSEWTKGSEEHGIPPIHPEEWLMDPNSARLASGEEFDAFGNRVHEGTGWHFVDHGILGKLGPDGKPRMAARWPRDFDERGRYTEANKPGVQMSAEDEEHGPWPVEVPIEEYMPVDLNDEKDMRL